MGHAFLREGVWYLQWRDALGKRRRKATSAGTRREAVGLLAELEAQSRRVNLGLEEAPAESRLTLGQLVTWWLYERCPEPSQKNSRLQLGKHVLRSKIADHPLPMVTADLLEIEVFGVMEKADSKPATINRVRGMLHSAFETAKEPPKKWRGKNPVSETRLRSVEKRDYFMFTPEQVALVLPKVPAQWRGTMAIAAYLGLRRGEIFALKKNDYDRERQIIAVFASHQRNTTKTHRRDTLPVPGILRPYLETARRTPGFFLFPDEDGHQRTRESDPHLILRRAAAQAGIAESWKSYCLSCAKAGRPHEEHSKTMPKEARRCSVDGTLRRVVPVPFAIRFHDLRHSCATNLIAAGVPIAHVSQIIRHASIKTTVDTYGHLVVDRHLREVVESGSTTQSTHAADAATWERVSRLPSWAGIVKAARARVGPHATSSQLISAAFEALTLAPEADQIAAMRAVGRRD